jgi:23S rRNA (pseudouridine1915-N3)-methyltransferase
MKLVLLGIGRLKAGPERELLRRYIARIEAGARAAGLRSVTVVECDEGKGRTVEQRRRDEAAALSERIPAGASVFLFDENGESLSSLAFAGELARARDAGSPTFMLCIGGPDGFDPDFLARFRRLSFGAMTLPHQLVRVLAAEQLYRALTIVTGHPYHRE